MNLFLVIILYFLSLQAYGQDSVYAEYEKKADTLMTKIKARSNSEGDVKELKQIAFGFQNYGQLLDESGHDHINALKYTDKAINFFTVLGDTASIANNNKFKGYLLGRLKRFPEAKAIIKTAIGLYQLLKKDAGVAVSQFDLSRVYEMENKFDSAIYYCNISLAYWNSKSVAPRMLGNQTMLINLLIKIKDNERAKATQLISEKLITTQDFHWQDLIDFYFVSAQLYKAINESVTAANYQKLYDNKIADLKKENIIARSYFDSKGGN